MQDEEVILMLRNVYHAGRSLAERQANERGVVLAHRCTPHLARIQAIIWLFRWAAASSAPRDTDRERDPQSFG